jgi:hypothetical protein
MQPQDTTVPEEWRPVPIDPLSAVYFVSNLGNVRRKNRDRRVRPWKTVKPYPQWHGYLLVKLHHAGVKKAVSLHRLVALAFVHRPDGRYEVHHIDGNKANNRWDNLEWVTKRENLTDADQRGLTRRGELNGKAKLTAHAVQEIRASDESASELARRYGVVPSVIGSVRSGRTWKHVR